jgi:gamma-glutamyltranspeptidase
LGYERMPVYGMHTINIPGCADGWATAAERFGRLGLARSVQSAIDYAENGFPCGPDLHSAITRMAAADVAHPSWRAHFTPGGVVPAVGEMVRYPTLARTLRTIAEQGAETFYRGEVATAIAEFFAREGGLITREDLAEHHSDWVTPLRVSFADLEILELPPNTQGVTALQLLGMLDGLTQGHDAYAPETVHLAVEAKKLAFADRDAYLTDPAFMQVDPATLITPDYLAGRRSLIDPEHAAISVAPGSLSGDTIYLCAADGDGNMVSLIQSNYMGFGSGVVVEDMGIVLHNRGAYFSLDPARANAIAPRKRTLHTLIPSMALRGGRPAIVFGSMGGDGQAQTHAQVYPALARFGMNIQAAIEMPRWIHGLRGDHEALVMENRFPPETIAALRERGHVVEEIGPWDTMMGYAQGIVLDPVTGVMQGGSDPRAEGCAAGW